MRNHEKYAKCFALLLVALLAGVALAGCHGNVGWDRMPGSLERQS